MGQVTIDTDALYQWMEAVRMQLFKLDPGSTEDNEGLADLANAAFAATQYKKEGTDAQAENEG